jgi:hypothetical protein
MLAAPAQALSINDPKRLKLANTLAPHSLQREGVHAPRPSIIRILVNQDLN